MNISFLDGYTINPGDLDWGDLSQLGHLTVYDRTAPDEVLARAGDADVVIVNKTALQRAHFESLPRLKLVCVAATGYDRIDLQAADVHGVTVTNCAGYSSRAVAQLVASFVLEVADSVGEYAEADRQGRWCQSPDFCYTLRRRVELVGKKLAVVGFGNIGQAVTDVMRPFGLQLHAVTSKGQEALPADVRKLTMEEAFADMDFVSLNCPLTDANRGFVNAALLRHSNPRLVLINTARGGIVSEQDVADALKEERLGAYCADVLAEEPPRESCPLLSAPRCFITPHIGWNTPEARRRIILILVDHIRNFLAGRPTGVVNHPAGA